MNRRELLAGAAALAVAPCLPKGLAASEPIASGVDLAAGADTSAVWFVRWGDGTPGMLEVLDAKPIVRDYVWRKAIIPPGARLAVNTETGDIFHADDT